PACRPKFEDESCCDDVFEWNRIAPRAINEGQRPLFDVTENADQGLLALDAIPELQLRLLPRETDEIGLPLELPFDPWRADFEIVAIRNRVGDVERGREIARDRGAEVEIDRGVLGRHLLRRCAELLHVHAKNPASLVLQLEVDELRPIGTHNGID